MTYWEPELVHPSAGLSDAAQSDKRLNRVVSDSLEWQHARACSIHACNLHSGVDVAQVAHLCSCGDFRAEEPSPDCGARACAASCPAAALMCCTSFEPRFETGADCDADHSQALLRTAAPGIGQRHH